MRLIDMRPTTAVYNPTNVATLHAKRLGNAAMAFSCSRSGPNRPYQIVSQNCSVMTLALLFAVLSHVERITLACIPAKVAECVVAGIIVVVARLHSIGTRPNKSKKYKPVNVTRAQFPVVPFDADYLPPVWVVSSGLELAPAISKTPSVAMAGPYTAVIANAIPVKTRNKGEFHTFPFYHHAGAF